MEKQDLVRRNTDLENCIKSVLAREKIEKIYFYPKKDEIAPNNKWMREIYLDQYDVVYYLNSLRDTKTCFKLEGENFSCSRLHSDRLKRVETFLMALNFAVEKSLHDGFEKGFGILSRFAYAVVVVKDNDIHYHNFVENKYENLNRTETYRYNGFYYNPDFGDKVLEYFKKGFNSTYMVSCYNCGHTENIAYQDNPMKQIKGRYYCSDCLERRNYGVCDLTGEEYFRKKIEFKSDIDKKEALKLLGKKAKLGMFVSANLLESKHIYSCERCGNLYVYHNVCYCNDCKKGMVGDYSDKNYVEIACRNENTKTKYGFELETELNRNSNMYNTVYKINDTIGDLIKIKHDGSLSNGFEIVSNILTFKKFCSVKNRFDLAFKNAIKDGCFSKRAQSTGLHIHVSREGFKDANHLARFCQAWYINKDFTRYCAQRDFGHYNCWDTRISTDKEYFKEFLNGDVYKTWSRSYRYNIVNINNENTVEIRIFKGVLSIDFLSYAIELCNLIKNYTEEHEQIKNKEMIKYIIKNSTRKLKEFVKFFLIKDRCAIKEVV